MSADAQGSPTVGLGRFIQGSQFVVPSHQRDYSWTEEYVQEFLRDIDEAISIKTENYFCGLMVFTSVGAASYKVLDGQQRLATTLMLFSSIRNWLSGFSAYSALHHQVGQYLGTQELGAADITPRLTMTAANNDAFQKYVIAAVPLAELAKAPRSVNKRSKVLLEACLQINRHIARRAGELGSSDLAKDHFVSMLRFITDNVQVVRFVVGSDQTAYTIFETLNDRGLELSALDLVKNYLFSHAEKTRLGSLKEFEERWAEMMALLSSSKPDSFLRAFWSSRHGKPEGSKLFTSFKKAYKPDSLQDVSVELRQSAETYAALSNPNDAIWGPFSQKARKSIEALSVVGFTQESPMILAALGRFNQREMERLLLLLECVAVRHQLVGRRRPGRVESLGGRAARDIYDRRLTTATDVLSQIRELYVPDEEFKLAFDSFDDTSAKKIRYVLGRLEAAQVARDGNSLDDELSPGNVTVEHICPRSPSDSWKDDIEKDHEWDEAYLSRLGNLCLLPGINHSLGNKSWDEKRQVYAKSRLETTKSLAAYAKWNRQQIVARQRLLSGLALEAWRFQ